MSNYELNTIFTAIKDGIRDIANLMRKSNPYQLSSHIGSNNISGDKVKSLDIESNIIMKHYLAQCSCIRFLASEEDDNAILVNQKGSYFVSFDPLDGSSNIDSNITTGTIYCVFKYNNNNEIKNGRQIVMAGYSVYGGSTLIVNSLNDQVQFLGLIPEMNRVQLNDGSDRWVVLDPANDKWVVLNNDYKMKSNGNMYAINESNKYRYDSSINQYIGTLINNNYTARWVGSLVADVHRTIIKGGIVMYPQNTKNPNGRIRLLYEAYPMAYVMRGVGGLSYDGFANLLDADFPLENNIHMKTPIYFGSEQEMQLLFEFL